MKKIGISNKEQGIVPGWRIAPLEVGGLRRTFRISSVKRAGKESKLIEKTHEKFY
jgi:hypothetical protein